jgi:hypothetical protein
MSTTTAHIPLRERVNVRVLIFAAIALVLIGWPVYTFVTYTGVEKSGDFYKVDLKAMSNFEMDQRNATNNDVPKEWRDLDGKKVTLEGEMWDAQGSGDSVKHFQLCYSIAKCCFQGPPKVQHFVDSHVPDGKSLEYYQNLVRVTGTLHVNVRKDGEKIASVYQLDVDSIEPKG